MSRNIRKFTVLVASPSDVSDERDSIDEVISELNKTYGNKNDVVIEVLRWETDSAPAVGLTSTQDIIDKDLGENYDLFIGLIWKKFGTPTHKYGSGTEQEFRNAYDRFKDEPESLQILFYFKTAQTSIYDIDPDQLVKIKEFRTDLGEKGVFYWEYNTIDELHKFLRIHIPIRIDGLIKSAEHISNQPTAIEKLEMSTIDSGLSEMEIISADELGVVDYLEIMEDSFAYATESLERIADATNIIGTEITKKAEELTALNARGQTIGNKILRDFFKRTAQVMDDFANRIEPEIPIYHSHFENGTDAIARLTAIYRSDGTGLWNNQISEAAGAVDGLLTGLETGLNSMIGFHDVVNTLPKMEKDLNRARRRVETILKGLVRSLEVSTDICKELYKDLTD